MKTVVLYTTSNCGACNQTKKRFDQLGISYQTIEADTEQVSRLKAEGYAAFPVVKVELGDGSSWSWSGFRYDDIARLAQLFMAG